MSADNIITHGVSKTELPTKQLESIAKHLFNIISDKNILLDFINFSNVAPNALGALSVKVCPF